MRVHAFVFGCAVAAAVGSWNIAPLAAADTPAPTDPFGDAPPSATADPFGAPAPAPAPSAAPAPADPFGPSAPAPMPFPLLRVLPPGPPPTPAQIAAGRELFEHRWIVGADRGNDGDGLGPLSNANSCAECHKQGGLGGGGGRDKDVELMTRSGQIGNAKANDVFRQAGFDRATTILLHAQGTSPGYEKLRLSLLSVPAVDDVLPLAWQRRLELTRRSTRPAR